MGDVPDSPNSSDSQDQANVNQTKAKKTAKKDGAQGQSPGELLAGGRAASELTVEEVGDALNLSAQTVRWLENDSFDSLPAAAFTQGYIRNYAKHVGLDADVVVAAYQEKAGKPAVSWESPSTGAGLAEMVQNHPGVLISAVVAGVVLLILIVLLVVWPEDSQDSEAATPVGFEQELPGLTADDKAPESASEAAAEQLSAADSVGNDSQTVSTIPGSAESIRYDSPRSLSDDSSAGSSGRDRDAIDPNDPLAHLPLAKTYPAGTRPVDVSVDSGAERARSIDEFADNSSVDNATDGNYPLTVSRRLTAMGSDQIRVEVTADCWIGIQSTAGKTLFGLLARPGQTLNLVGEGPFRVKLGYSSGVELFFNDNPVLLEPYTRNEVASLVIGQ